MGSLMGFVLWIGVFLLDLVVHSVSLPGIDDRGFIEECVKEHNRARSAVNPPADNMLYMTWDEGLAITARAWARRCTFEHNIYHKQAHRMHPTFTSVGENLWTGVPPSYFNVTTAIKKWVDEKQAYSYEQNTCSNVCGHYTQVVWSSSYKVGCAVQLCPNGVKSYKTAAGAIFVCNYATAGNVNGRRPYESNGGPCSGCKGKCVNNLCRNTERDAPKSYSWTPDWDAPLMTSKAGGSGYIPIVVVRPCTLILTFIAAYAVHYFYPDVFCYE